MFSFEKYYKKQIKLYTDNSMTLMLNYCLCVGKPDAGIIITITYKNICNFNRHSLRNTIF